MSKDGANTSTQRNGTISSRLATVETRVEALHHSVESLTRSVEILTQQIGKIGRMNWPLLVTGLGVLAAWTGVIGFIGRMAIEPVRVELNHLREQVQHHQSDGHPHTVRGEIQTLGSRTNQRFADVDSQLRSLRAISRLQSEQTAELIELKTRLAVYRSRHGRLEESP